MDTIADVIAWLVLIVVPAGGVYVFWQLHILPEKIAHKRQHPQIEAIKAICLLSLVFGGILWPLAWIWAYSKPVMHRLAFGQADTRGEEAGGEQAAVGEGGAESTVDVNRELDRLHQRLMDLERTKADRPEERS